MVNAINALIGEAWKWVIVGQCKRKWDMFVELELDAVITC